MYIVLTVKNTLSRLVEDCSAASDKEFSCQGLVSGLIAGVNEPVFSQDRPVR